MYAHTYIRNDAVAYLQLLPAVVDAFVKLNCCSANKPEKRLVLFYLANDVVQNGRKKARDLIVQFGKTFYDAVALLK